MGRVKGKNYALQPWHRICIMTPRRQKPAIGTNEIRIMKLHTNEMLLALRSPSSGWLAAMVCALEEAVRDPDFSEHHRELVRQMLDVNAIPAPIAAAAQERLSRFEEEVTNTQVELYDSLSTSVAAQPSRPKLTLVSSVAA
jgi:hypothetical protein